MTTGERIKAARNNAGIKQSELAAKLGVAVITIGQYERGKRQPRIEQLFAIADALNIPVEDLLGIAPENRIVSSSDKLLYFFDKLNTDGQQKAVERVEELTQIPRYRGESTLEAAERRLIETASRLSPPQEPPENGG